ncbi:MAG: carboxymuconolactone decarboxylase family protein, partial [Euryarchaeota archaeon]|nr:carboxymuconolactone decarboxylase family protein [Euryarchaeota archaeon]
QRCEACCESQMRSAINHGATKEEIMETINVIFITSGAPGVATCRKALPCLRYSNPQLKTKWSMPKNLASASFTSAGYPQRSLNRSWKGATSKR